MANSFFTRSQPYTVFYLCLLILIISIICSQFFYANIFYEQEYHYLNSDDQSLIRTLNCSNIKQISRISLIGQGTVKKVYLARYKSLNVVLSELSNDTYSDDFSHHILMIKALQPSKKVTKYIGQCNNSIIVTKFYPFGDPMKFKILTKYVWKHLLKPKVCINLCLSYASLIKYLHNSHAGTRVMCDSNDLIKLLSQLLITEDLQVIANDLDALPLSLPLKGIKCGHRQINGDFVAPEQQWPFPNEPFNDSKMPSYNEKIDIWKLPDVCAWFLELCNLSNYFHEKLAPINHQCKNRNPLFRPTASHVYKVYHELLSEW